MRIFNANLLSGNRMRDIYSQSFWNPDQAITTRHDTKRPMRRELHCTPLPPVFANWEAAETERGKV